MTVKEFRKLGKKEIMELLLEQTKRADRLEEELNEAKKSLSDRSLKMERIGSIAEASLEFNHVFEAAQKAADDYIENIRSRMGDTDSACKAMIAEATAVSDSMVAEATEKSEAMIAEATERSETMVAEAASEAEKIMKEAKAETDQYWENVKVKLDAYYEAHQGLKELLGIVK